jgi:radical SAM protein with 4Fe4S-binding SPASM domain
MIRFGNKRRPASRPVAPPAPIWVEVSPHQPHQVDLRWVEELVASVRPHLVVRPEDELVILLPNTPIKVNKTALRILSVMLHEGAGIADVLSREGDTPRRRSELHDFFTDLAAWLRGELGEADGRRAVLYEPFRRDFCRYPLLSEIALTYECDLKCSFCYAACGSPGMPREGGRMTLMTDDEVGRVLEIIRHDARCPSVSFTGGEPTLRAGLPRLVRRAKDLGLSVNLISNGQHLSDALTGRLAGSGLDSAQLSLEGPDASIHDRLVGRKGAFDRLWDGIECLRARGVRVHTNTTVTRHNIERLEEIVDLAAERGLQRVTMNLLIPCGRAASDSGLRVSYSEIGERILQVKARAEFRKIGFVWYSPVPLCIFNSISHGLGNRGCAAADGLLHVAPSGDVLPCSSFPLGETLGNLLRQDFDSIWQSRRACHFRDKCMMPSDCDACPDAEACQGACTLYWRSVGHAELAGRAPGTSLSGNATKGKSG